MSSQRSIRTIPAPATTTDLETELKHLSDQTHIARKISDSLVQRAALLKEFQALTMRLSVANAAIMMESMVTQFDAEELSDDDAISYAGKGSSAFQTIETQVDAVWKIANELNQVRRDLRNQENHLASLLRSIGRVNTLLKGSGRTYTTVLNNVVYTLTVADGAASLSIEA